MNVHCLCDPKQMEGGGPVFIYPSSSQLTMMKDALMTSLFTTHYQPHQRLHVGMNLRLYIPISLSIFPRWSAVVVSPGCWHPGPPF